MTAERYRAQQDRIERIAHSVFPDCIVCFGTEPKPHAMQLWITNQNQTICAFPGETDIDEVERMSDEQIEKRIRETSK